MSPDEAFKAEQFIEMYQIYNQMRWLEVPLSPKDLDRTTLEILFVMHHKVRDMQKK